ncbi:hypothetical protein QBC39DRAFT_341834 [Podospora conica]|nr:hypothetical protein QBC39DRAFT_341834 [Schizothecium conicum]
MSAAACRHSLRIGSRTLGSLPIAAPGQMRWLSSTPSLGKAVIHFQRTGSPELKKILADLYEYVILPEYLTPEQRKKIYKKKYEKELVHNPITVDIDGKKHEFRYRNLLTDKPSVKSGVTNAVTHMKTKGDFARNLFPLLEGCYSVAKLKPAGPDTFVKITSRAGDAGAIGAVLECIYKSKQTKFYLQTHELVNELFFQLQRGAWESGWDRETTEKGIRRINKVLDLLESDPHHEALPDSGPAAYPFYRDPQFLAARLHLQAALALRPRKDGKKKDEDAMTPEEEEELVAKYALEILRLWPPTFGLLDLRPDQVYRLRHGMMYLLRRRVFVWTAAPIVSAFRMARDVLSKDEKHAELVQALEHTATQVEKELAIALPQSIGSERAVGTYKALFPDETLPQKAEKLPKEGRTVLE